MLNAQDIQNQQFNVRFRGFDMEEVDEFLERSAATVQALSEENRTLNERIELAEQKIEASQQREKVVMDAILAAQSVAQEMKEKAQQLLSKAQEEAREIRAKAQAEAREIKEDAVSELADLKQQLDQLKEMTAQVRQETRLLLESYLVKLDLDDNEPRLSKQPPQADSLFEDAKAPAATGQAPLTPRAELAELNRSLELPDELESPAIKQEARPVSQVTEARVNFLQGLAGNLAFKAESPDEPAPLTPDSSSISPGLEEWVLPNLDEDLVFNLEDPLDAIDEKEAQQERKGKIR